MLAAFAFAFGGSAAWRIQHIGQIMSFAWLPVTLWLLARALDRRSALYGAAAGAVAALLVLGRDQVAFLGVLMLSAYAPIASRRTTRPKLSGAYAARSPARSSASTIIAVPLAFTLELAAHSNRPEIDLDGAFKGSLPPASFWTLISANMFGTDGPLKDFWGPPAGERDLFLARNMTDVYMGALTLVSLLAALGRRFFSNKEIRFFAAAALCFRPLCLRPLHAGLRASSIISPASILAPARRRHLPVLRDSRGSRRLWLQSHRARRGHAAHGLRSSAPSPRCSRSRCLSRA